MTKTVLTVEGMMCKNCEAHMNAAIREGFRVKSVESSHEAGETVILSAEPLSEDALREAVAATGFVLKGIRTEAAEKKGFSIFRK